ncbi:hypothetical protein D3C78_1795410 [compost metagenome]
MRTASIVRSHSLTLSAPNRITARELCELNDEGLCLIASWINVANSSLEADRLRPSEYCVRRFFRASR